MASQELLFGKNNIALYMHTQGKYLSQNLSEKEVDFNSTTAHIKEGYAQAPKTEYEVRKKLYLNAKGG